MKAAAGPAKARARVPPTLPVIPVMVYMFYLPSALALVNSDCWIYSCGPPTVSTIRMIACIRFLLHSPDVVRGCEAGGWNSGVRMEAPPL